MLVPLTNFLIPSHALKVMSHVPQSLQEHRHIQSVKSPLALIPGLILSSALTEKGGMNVSNSLFVVFEREKEIFYNLCFDLL